MKNDFIEITGAKVHNLKNVNLKIPKNKMVVFTGVSGSGKSSLAFDTLYAEGQRRYVESLSSYARQFLGLMEKPDVESITGLSPAISIDQKTSSSNPRSTVGTVTEIYDYLRLLYGQVGETHCPNCGRPVRSQSIHEIAEEIINLLKDEKNVGAKMQIMSPVIQGKKGQYIELLDSFLSKGFIRARIDGEIHSLEEIDANKIDKNKKHNIDLIVDRLVPPADLEDKEFNKRLIDALEVASSLAEGEIKVMVNEEEVFFSENNTCFNCKISFPQIKPASFSFNSPHGACPKCAGLGDLKQVDVTTIYNPKLSISQGGIFPWSNMTTNESSWTYKLLDKVAEEHSFSLKVPIKEYSPEIFNLIFYGKGANKGYKIRYENKQGFVREYFATYEGIIPNLERRYLETESEFIRREVEKYMFDAECSECHGKRLKPYSLAVTVGDTNIDSLCRMQIEETREFIDNLGLKGNAAQIATPILREISSRLKFLADVGLTYLTLHRKANTLSGGESQRIRLASQIGTGLTGVLYVLDEPSIGLHSRDVSRLIGTLENLRDLGNSLVVVEHDFDTIAHADYLVDIGPGAGENGGVVTGEGTPDEFITQDTITAKYMRNELYIGKELEANRKVTQKSKAENLKKPAKSRTLTLKGVTTNNLKNVTAEFPLGELICVTGVSGSGKSSLVNDTLYPILMNEKMKSNRQQGKYEEVTGLEAIDKVVGIDQSPIGRTPRSNPATYTGVFDFIRQIFSETPEAKARGYKSGRFSFNVKGGRCEKCGGDGQIKIEMQFLADMYVTCEECQGKRYNKDALQIDYKGKNIADVLEMTVSEALEFFEKIPHIHRKLELLNQVGLGYIRLGQSATTLSGGESQRIKLAKELSKSMRGHTFYILDEPTTGLHFHDIDKLLTLLTQLVDRGNTVLVIEHNLDIVRFSDWVIDIGPEGGDKGGQIVFEGTVKDLMNSKKSYTGEFLKQYVEEQASKKK